MNAIEVLHASKIYRRYDRRRQFATLKSALLSRSLVRDLKPDETFAAVQDVSFTVPLVGFVIPATSFSIVLLPDPFRPITPSVRPLGTVKDTSVTAENVSSGFRSRTRLRDSRALLSVANCRRRSYRR